MYRIPTLNWSGTAGGAIGAYCAVMAGTGNQAIQATAAAVKQIGIIEGGAVTAGQEVTVTLEGIQEAQTGGAVTMGDPLTSDANGKLVVATAAQLAIAYAMRDGASGDIIPVKVGRHQVAA